MDKATMGMVGKAMEKGEKSAPLKSIKLKVKFQKKDDSKYDEKKRELAKKKK